MPSEWIHVAAAVITNDKQQCLIAKRLAHKHQGNLWEFPGGKVHEDESALQALARELKEELDIEVSQAEPLIQIKHRYHDKNIFLDVYRVDHFSGQEKGNEGQEIQWVSVANLKQYAFPAANQMILKVLCLPERIAIASIDKIKGLTKSHAEKLSEIPIDIVLYRDYESNEQEYLANAHAVNKTLAAAFPLDKYHKQSGVMVVRPDLMLPFIDAFAGLHLASRYLQDFQCRPVPDSKLLSAACHNIKEIRMAEALNCDFIFLSPVMETTSHPDTNRLGWALTEKLVSETELPVILLGGMTLADFPKAKSIGALGIAGISKFWTFL